VRGFLFILVEKDFKAIGIPMMVRRMEHWSMITANEEGVSTMLITWNKVNKNRIPNTIKLMK
jgi:hypothetical protein